MKTEPVSEADLLKTRVKSLLGGPAIKHQELLDDISCAKALLPKSQALQYADKLVADLSARCPAMAKIAAAVAKIVAGEMPISDRAAGSH